MEIREAYITLTKLILPLVETIFVKGREETPNHVASSSISPLCTYCKKYIHTQSGYHSRFFERYKSQLNRLRDEFDFLKNKILHIKKRKKKSSSS